MFNPQKPPSMQTAQSLSIPFPEFATFAALPQEDLPQEGVHPESYDAAHILLKMFGYKFLILYLNTDFFLNQILGSKMKNASKVIS